MRSAINKEEFTNAVVLPKAKYGKGSEHSREAEDQEEAQANLTPRKGGDSLMG